jgi:hypothetical protein
MKLKKIYFFFITFAVLHLQLSYFVTAHKVKSVMLPSQCIVCDSLTVFQLGQKQVTDLRQLGRDRDVFQQQCTLIGLYLYK